MEESETTAVVGAALLRMKRAHDRNTGCHLTSEMIEALGRSTIGEWWENVAEDGSSLL